jgi:plastocyanin
MSGLSFSPSNLTVPAGTSVTWQNGSNVTHTVTSATGSTLTYDSGNVGIGGLFSQTFNTAGTYHYYCKIHGSDGTPPSGMSGTITVQ